MTIKELLSKTGLPVAFGHFDKSDSVRPPFLVYLYDQPDTLHADDVNYFTERSYILEHYFTVKDYAVEDAINKLLTNAGISYSQSGDVWIESEKIWVNYIYFQAGLVLE